MLWLFKRNFCGFRRFLIHDNSSYVVLYTQCLRCNICSAWFLDIGISTCFIDKLQNFVYKKEKFKQVDFLIPKNQALQILYLKHRVHTYIKLHKLLWIRNLRNPQKFDLHQNQITIAYNVKHKQ